MSVVENEVTKSDVIQLQRALRENVAPDLVIDGAWGNACDIALGRYATANALTIDAAKELLYKYADTRYVSENAFEQAATALGVPKSYVRAVAEVETNGESFLKDGSVKILFERHWFKRKLGEALATPAVRINVAIKENLYTSIFEERFAIGLYLSDNPNIALGNTKRRSCLLEGIFRHITRIGILVKQFFSSVNS
jgi:hypothetical protein